MGPGDEMSMSSSKSKKKYKQKGVISHRIHDGTNSIFTYIVTIKKSRV